MRNFVPSLFTSLARLGGALALVASALAANPLSAQDTGGERIIGIVTTTTGQPVSDVRITVTGTRLGAMTTTNGRYVIVGITAGTYDVRAQRIGFAPSARSVTVSAGQVAVADFQLQVVATVLDEVKVGYTTQDRRTVSDAVASVKASDVQGQPTATIEEKLRGRIPGVQVTSTGEPGRSAEVIVRGQNFLGGVSPLYVVDGMYLRENPNLNPDDIETIDVLKDASATAQYGAQAANGVIVITTRRGSNGAPRVGADAYYGYQDIPNRIEMASLSRWTEITRAAYANANPGDSVLPSGFRNPTRNTDWQDAIFQTGAIQNLNASIAGGTDQASYLVSGGYLKQTGAVIRTGFDRYSLRVNSEGRSGRLTLGENVAVSRTTRANLNGFPLIDAVRLLPVIPVYDPSTPSGYGYGSAAAPTFGTNPVGAQYSQDNTENSNQLIGTVYADVGLLSFLKYRFNAGINYEDYQGRNFRRQTQLRQNTVPDSTELVETRDNASSILLEHTLNLNNSFGLHQINAVAGFTEQLGNYDRITATRRGYENPDLGTIDVGTQRIRNSGFRTEANLRSFLARANYTFADRYIVTGSARRDGSTRFGPGKKYGNFGAASLGWVLSEERFYGAIPFMSNAVNYFKLRASYGSIGNQDIGDYRYEASIGCNLGYLFGGNIVPGCIQRSFADPSIHWQANQQTNVGFDMNLMQSAFTFTADYYQSASQGLLAQPPLPPSSGSQESPFVNAGKVKNAGVEVGLTHKYEAGRFGLNTALTLNTIKNKVVSLGNGGQPIFAGPFGIARTAVGAPIGSYYVRHQAGIFQNQAEIDAYVHNGAKIQPNAKPGDVKYQDRNNDGLINDLDRYNAGSAVPKLQGGLFFDAKWSSFDAQLGLRGSYGAKVFNVVKFWTDRTDENSARRAGFSPWTPTNPSNSTPRAAFGPAGVENNSPYSDRWIEKNDYLRIQNLQFGYALPPNLGFRGMSMPTQSARVYIAVQNLYTFTKFSNWDPEVLGQGDALARGFDDGRIYPNVRTLTFGVTLR